MSVRWLVGWLVGPLAMHLFFWLDDHCLGHFIHISRLLSHFKGHLSHFLSHKSFGWLVLFWSFSPFIVNQSDFSQEISQALVSQSVKCHSVNQSSVNQSINQISIYQSSVSQSIKCQSVNQV